MCKLIKIKIKINIKGNKVKYNIKIKDINKNNLINIYDQKVNK